MRSRFLLVFVLIFFCLGKGRGFAALIQQPNPKSNCFVLSKCYPLAIRYRQKIDQKIILPPRQSSGLLGNPALADSPLPLVVEEKFSLLPPPVRLSLCMRLQI